MSLLRRLPHDLTARRGSGPVRSIRLAAARYRRLLAALCVAAAVVATLSVLAPAPEPTRSVLVATHDLEAGRVLDPADVASERWPADAVPEARLLAVRGLVLASPLRRGEPLTDARVIGTGLLTGQPGGTVAVPVRPADPGITRLVRAGDRVDVLAGTPDDMSAAARGSQGAERVAYAALVLAVPLAGTSSAEESGLSLGPAGADDGDGGGLLVLGVDSTTAARLAGAQASGRLLSLTLRGGDGQGATTLAGS